MKKVLNITLGLILSLTSTVINAQEMKTMQPNKVSCNQDLLMLEAKQNIFVSTNWDITMECKIIDGDFEKYKILYMESNNGNEKEYSVGTKDIPSLNYFIEKVKFKGKEYNKLNCMYQTSNAQPLHVSFIYPDGEESKDKVEDMLTTLSSLVVE
jgi:hypothetical protein